MPFTDTQQIGHIREMQRYLHRISQTDDRINTTIPNGVFDERTRQAVQSFQAIYGLPVTGEIDPVTWDAIVRVYSQLAVTMPTMIDVFPDSSYIITPQSNTVLVEFLQVMLRFLSQLYPGTESCDITGVYDAKTIACVKRAQDLFLLEPTGFVDMNTWNVIVKYVNYASLLP